MGCRSTSHLDAKGPSLKVSLTLGPLSVLIRHLPQLIISSSRYSPATTLMVLGLFVMMLMGHLLLLLLGFNGVRIMILRGQVS